jgi:hypothetical protein
MPIARNNDLSEKVFENNFLYEGAAIFESILKRATKHASAGNASKERGLREKRFFKYFLSASNSLKSILISCNWYTQVNSKLGYITLFAGIFQDGYNLRL